MMKSYPTKSVQHGPSRLIATQAQNTLKAQRADPMFLIGDVPNGCKPNTKLSSCLIKYGASSDRRLMATGWADQSGTTACVNFSDHATFGANKAIRPTKLL
jgi:hypothetical protein